MKLELAAYLFLFLLSSLVIGTLLTIDNALFDDIWFCINWLCMIVVGIYFFSNTKIQIVKHGLIGLTSWIFSGLIFRIIYMAMGISSYAQRPTEMQPVLWYTLFFIFYITISTLNERKNSSRDS